jgi:hypothetical protein
VFVGEVALAPPVLPPRLIFAGVRSGEFNLKGRISLSAFEQHSDRNRRKVRSSSESKTKSSIIR